MSDTFTPVGLGELRASRDPNEVLVCYGLGSCIGLVLYDAVVRAAGMVHVVLPDSALARRGDEPPGKYANRAVPALLDEMIRLGAARSRLRARMTGGAHVLQLSGAGPRLDVGTRNAEAVRAALERLDIRLVSADTGGHHGRTMQCQVGLGRVLVSTVGQGEREL